MSIHTIYGSNVMPVNFSKLSNDLEVRFKRHKTACLPGISKQLEDDIMPFRRKK